MANQKYFLVTHQVTQHETLVGAPKDSLAIAAVAGDAADVRPATDDDIVKFAGQLHPRSVEPGAGKYFVLGDQIIRAKNPATAFALVNQDTYTAKVLNQDELVQAMTRQLKPIYYQAKARPDAAAPTPPPAANSDGQPPAASNDDASPAPALAAQVG